MITLSIWSFVLLLIAVFAAGAYVGWYIWYEFWSK